MSHAALGFNVANFRSVVDQKGIAKPNKFLVRFNLPRGLFGVAGTEFNIETIRYLEYWAESVTMPSIGLGLQQAYRYGYGAFEQRPYHPIFQAMNVTLMFDEYGDNWQLFYDWINMTFNTKMDKGINTLTGEVNNHGTGENLTYTPYELAYRIEYVTDVEIKVFAQNGEVLKSIVMREAFPVSMGGMPLDWSDNNSYLRLPIQFVYTDWQHAPLTNN